MAGFDLIERYCSTMNVRLTLWFRPGHSAEWLFGYASGEPLERASEACLSKLDSDQHGLLRDSRFD